MGLLLQCSVAAVALMCLISPIRSDDVKEAMVAMVKDCKEKTGASDADIDALRNRKLPESKEGVCMIECFYDHAKVMQDGKYNKEGFIAALTPMMAGDEAKITKLKEMADVCGKEADAVTGDKCEVGQKLMHCTVEKGKEFGFEYPINF